MPIEEMRKREWTINWSGGKDSTATIIACIKYGVPIKEVNYVRMMYDDKLPATLPIMTEFVDKTAERLRKQYDIVVNVIKSAECKTHICDKVYIRSKYPVRNGKRYTLAALGRGFCWFAKYKSVALESIKRSEYEMIGYTIDEPKRYGRLKHPSQESILCTLGITETKAFEICKKNNMLSPLYSIGAKRDGCWFCPNCSKYVIEYIKRSYPELVEIIYEDFSTLSKERLYSCTRNSWIDDYKRNLCDI